MLCRQDLPSVIDGIGQNRRRARGVDFWSGPATHKLTRRLRGRTHSTGSNALAGVMYHLEKTCVAAKWSMIDEDFNGKLTVVVI